MTVTARELAAFLDAHLRVAEIPDYPAALNGLQCDHQGPVRRIGAAVDLSRRAIAEAASHGVNFLLVHHGMFWGGLQPLTGPSFTRVRLLIESDMAVYSAHLPLDAHPAHGNNVLLARTLGLEPSGTFAEHHGVPVGVCGDSDLETSDLVERARRFSAELGGNLRTSAWDPGQRTLRWAVCTGAGASTETLRAARVAGIDTLIVGEGPHHTAVILYAGHYATETPGVRSVAALLTRQFGIPSEFVFAPTGL
jgi:dinuclear metal center YbgI/SA1388 family protein